MAVPREARIPLLLLPIIAGLAFGIAGSSVAYAHPGHATEVSPMCGTDGTAWVTWRQIQVDGVWVRTEVKCDGRHRHETPPAGVTTVPADLEKPGTIYEWTTDTSRCQHPNSLNEAGECWAIKYVYAADNTEGYVPASSYSGSAGTDYSGTTRRIYAYGDDNRVVEYHSGGRHVRCYRESRNSDGTWRRSANYVSDQNYCHTAHLNTYNRSQGLPLRGGNTTLVNAGLEPVPGGIPTPTDESIP